MSLLPPKTALVDSVLELLHDPAVAGLIDPQTRDRVLQMLCLSRSNQATVQLATSALGKTSCTEGCTMPQALEVFVLALSANAAALLANSAVSADNASKLDNMAAKVDSLWKDSKNGGLRSKPAGKDWLLLGKYSVPRALVVRTIYHAIIGAAIMAIFLKSFSYKVTDEHGKTTEAAVEMRGFK